MTPPRRQKPKQQQCVDTPIQFELSFAFRQSSQQAKRNDTRVHATSPGALSSQYGVLYTANISQDINNAVVVYRHHHVIYYTVYWAQ